MSEHNILGKDGEEEALKYIQEKSYEVLERNYRYSRSEVDIIARYAGKIIFIEVKTRTSYAFGYPEESVSANKQKLLVKAAEYYLEQNNLDCECRFDVLAIFKNKDGKWFIKHFEDAFYPLAGS